MVRLLGICGSMRLASLNRALLVAVGESLPAGATLEIYPTVELPIFSSDRAETDAVTAMKTAIGAADGVVFGVPEYNYSIPGGFKNALDWMSTPLTTAPLRGKPVAMVGAATGMSGTIRAQTHLRQILLFSDSPTLAQPEVLIPRAQERFDASGRLVDESTRALLRRFGEAFVALISRHEPPRSAV